MINASELAFIIMISCNVSKQNIDTKEVSQCVDFINNCSVDERGEITRTKVKKCVEKQNEYRTYR